MTPSLQAQSLKKTFGRGSGAVSAVAGVSLSVSAGESLAITGESGSGKSTLLSLLAGLEQPDSGQVLVEGRDLTKLDETALALFRGQRMGIVFQSFRLLPNLSALENVRLPLDLAGVPTVKAGKTALQWLDEMGLAGRAGHLPGQLSGGEQQRVALARALAPNPAVLLADEPTGNLDSKNGALVEKMLLSLAKRLNTALIIVTHDKKLAAKADRQLPMRDGRVVKGR